MIDDFLRRSRALARPLEIIVVDGGSSDGTAAIAERRADRVIASPRGRASQMNAGAAIARGEVLWFLHADLNPPADSVERIAEALTDPKAVGGCFSLRYPRIELIYRVSDSLGNIGIRLFGLPSAITEFSAGAPHLFRPAVIRSCPSWRTPKFIVAYAPSAG